MKRGISRKGLKQYCKSAIAALLALAMVIGTFTTTTITVKAADENCIVLDGGTNDWDYIEKYLRDQGGFAAVAAFTTDDALYVLRDLSDVNGYAQDQMYIDADGDTTNGYADLGIDYLLQGSNLYTYTGIAGAWGWGGGNPFEVKMTADKVVAEYKIPLSSLGNPTGKIRINIGAVKSDWTMLASYPTASTTLIEVPALEEVYTESDSSVISDFTFTASSNMMALTENTMEGGTVGTFSAQGGDGTYKYTFAPSNTYGVDNSKFQIIDNKLVVKNELLAPGSYSVFVKVSSDIRSEKKAFSFVVEAADAATTIDESVFTGKNGQWFAVNHNAANSIPTMSELKAVTDGYYLYAYVSSQALSNMAEFYIKTPNQGGNDITDSWFDGDEVDYKVSVDGTVYVANGSGWDVCGSAECFKNSIGAEIKVALSTLGNAKGNILVGVKDGESSILPNKGEEMLVCSTPILSEAPEITLDGQPEDWAGISPIADGTGTLGNLYAFRDSENLYVMSYVKNADFNSDHAVSTNLLINADGDSLTGYLHGGFKTSGADFLVQDWYSNDYGTNVKNIEFFYTANSEWKWTSVSAQNTYKAYGASGENYCIEYVLPIADMTSVSTAISDDLYIAIDREHLQSDVPSGSTPTSGKFVKVPKYNTTVPVVIGDESFADWTTVSNRATNTAVDTLTNLFATCSSERLYTLVTSENGGLNTVNMYYISTGDSTGFNYAGFENIDYIVKDAKLFKVTADDTLSEAVDDVWMSYYNDSVEMQLYLSMLGNPSTIKIAWRGIDGTALIPSENSLLNVTAKFSLGRAEGYYYPTEDFASFGNPYKGWVGWATRYEDDANDEFFFEKNTVYLAVRWSEFEPTKGVYDYKGIEDKYNLDYWKSQGVRINVRFLMDNPEVLTEGQESRMDIPMWLYNELEAEVAKGNIDSAGTFYNDMVNLGGAGFSPNYNSELLIGYHEKAIEALARYFDDNTISSFVQIGSLGHWGEFHTWPEGTGVFPIPSVCTKYMEAYTKYFKNVKVGLRKPYPYAASNDFGLFNDIFGVSAFSGTDTFLGYINNGDIDMSPAATSEEIMASVMPNFWKKNYSGGEFAEGNINLHVTNEGIIGCLEQVRDTHVSWLGPCSAADYMTRDINAYLYEANILALQKQMGYNFALERISKLDTIKGNEDTALSMIWNNEGVAPFYYDWPLELSLIDGSGEVAYKQTISADIMDWMPGRTNVDVIFNVPNTVKPGDYTLAIAIADKDTLEPSIRLAVEGGRSDLRYSLYQVKVDTTGKEDEQTTPSVPVTPVTPAHVDVVTPVKNLVSAILNPVKTISNIIKAFGPKEDGTKKTAKEVVSDIVTSIFGPKTAKADGIEDGELEGAEVDAANENVVNDETVTAPETKSTNYTWPIVFGLVVILGAAGAAVYFKFFKKGEEIDE